MPEEGVVPELLQQVPVGHRSVPHRAQHRLLLCGVCRLQAQGVGLEAALLSAR